MNTSYLTTFTLLLLLVSFASSRLAASEIYHWVDDNGVAHYSQYKPTDDVVNVSTQKLLDTAPHGNGEVEDVFNVEEHEKNMVAWREERAQKQKEARDRKQRLAEQQRKTYPQPNNNNSWPYGYPVYGRPPIRPPVRPPIRPPGQPERPIFNPRPPTTSLGNR